MTNQMRDWQHLRCQHVWYPMVSAVYAGGYVVGSTRWICLNCGAVRAEKKDERQP